MKKRTQMIPDRFKLFGETVEVVYDKELNNQDSSNGMANYRYSRIELQPSTDAIPRTPESMEHSYLHEVTHFILNAIGEEELRDNEKFVELFSRALHQVLTTGEYDNAVSNLVKEKEE